MDSNPVNWHELLDLLVQRGVPGLFGCSTEPLSERLMQCETWQRRAVVTSVALVHRAHGRAEVELTRWAEAGIRAADERQVYLLLRAELYLAKLRLIARELDEPRIDLLRGRLLELTGQPLASETPLPPASTVPQAAVAATLCLIDADSISEEKVLQLRHAVSQAFPGAVTFVAAADSTRSYPLLKRVGIRVVQVAPAFNAADRVLHEIGNDALSPDSDTARLVIATQDKGFGPLVQAWKNHGREVHVIPPRIDASYPSVTSFFSALGATTYYLEGDTLEQS